MDDIFTKNIANGNIQDMYKLKTISLMVNKNVVHPVKFYCFILVNSLMYFDQSFFFTFPTKSIYCNIVMFL